MNAQMKMDDYRKIWDKRLREHGESNVTKEEFYAEVRKLFPNAKRETVYHYMGSDNFCHDFGGISMTKVPPKDAEQIKLINLMSMHLRR